MVAEYLEDRNEEIEDVFVFEFVEFVVQELDEKKDNDHSIYTNLVQLLNPVKLIVALADVPGFFSMKIKLNKKTIRKTKLPVTVTLKFMNCV